MKHLLLLGIAFAAFCVSHSNPPEYCQLASDEGTGTTIKYVIYYDAKEGQCYPFIYNGQGGNENRFENEKDCIRTCSPKAESIYPIDEREACHLKKADGKGRCINTLLRYYYDSVHEKCMSFYWSGCNGNGNRFPNKQACNETCYGIHDDGEDPLEEESDTPVAIILGVLLALVIVGILITVVVLIVKSKKKKSKKEGGKKRDPKSDAPLQEQGIEMA